MHRPAGMLAELTLFAPAVSIYGGSDEVQHNIIGERVLGLPSRTPYRQDRAVQGPPPERLGDDAQRDDAALAPIPTSSTPRSQALLDPVLEPIVEMVITADDDGYEARDGRRPGAVHPQHDDGTRLGVHRAPSSRVATRSATRPPTGSRRWPMSAPSPWPDRTADELPVRLRDGRPDLRPARPHPMSSACTPPPTTGRTTAVSGASTDRWASCRPGRRSSWPAPASGRSAWCRGPAGWSTWRPTVLALMGGAPHPDGVGLNGRRRPDALLRRQDGEVLDRPDRPPRPDPTTSSGFLFDGCNPNVLYDAVAAGEAPNVARLIEMGTAFEHGAMSSMPTVTLANHTSILTGCHPGHHGILNNAWYDRAHRPAGHHELAGHVAVVDGDAVARRRDDVPGGEAHLARRVHPRRQRAVRHRRRLRHVPPPARRAPCRSGRRGPRTCRSPPSGSCDPRSRTRPPRGSTTSGSR